MEWWFFFFSIIPEKLMSINTDCRSGKELYENSKGSNLEEKLKKIPVLNVVKRIKNNSL